LEEINLESETQEKPSQRNFQGADSEGVECVQQ
jgi:hypothetical protein